MKSEMADALQFYREAKTLTKISNTEAQRFIGEVLENTQSHPEFKRIEAARDVLLKNKQRIAFVDHGAGSKKGNAGQKTISEIAQAALSTPRQCRQMFYLVQYCQAKKVVELGTSLGISTAYLSLAQPSKVIGLEGDAAVAKEAQKLLQKLNCTPAEIRQGTFAQNLPQALADAKAVDLVYIDGHHTYAATLEYTQMILAYAHGRTVLVYDDINWSEEMRQAWQAVKDLPAVKWSLRTFNQGFVFLGGSTADDNHLAYLPKKFKPWQ
jgi:predicted O-methyltransferase YrrM